MVKDLDTDRIERIFESLPALSERERLILAAAGVMIPAPGSGFSIKAGYVIFDGSTFEFELRPGNGHRCTG